MPGRRLLPRLTLFAALAVLCGLAAPPARAQNGSLGQQQTMPSVTGMSESEATSRLRQFGMQVETRPMESSRPRGTVIRQQPAAGTAIKPGALAVIGVSTGPPVNADTPRTNGGQTQPTGGRGIDVGIEVRPPRPGLVPNVVGMSLPAARARLIASMLRPGRVDSAFVDG
ncbi:MAG TPA: PASTA domain-containing protein, partial [Longimicrobiaceae bacterium]|nr:PASTA domain-containing protein [Longimicrobiaceae bacterium]